MSAELHKVDHIVTDVLIYDYYRALDCPRSLSCYLLYKYKEFDQLVSLDCIPLDYNSPENFRDAYLATNFLSKNRFLRTTFDTKKRALEKFEQSEAKCKETNRIWNSRKEFSLFDWNSISRVSEKLFHILGPSPNIDRVIDRSSWGPGASTLIKSIDASSYKKFSDERGITIEASGLCSLIDKIYPLIPVKFFQFELGDRVVVVPKNAKIDRVILIQPGWNLWFQKGVGQVLRQKLARFGLHLDNSDKRNQQLAKISSQTGHLATIDFTSASDQIAIEPLREVLPPDWFRLLDGLRCKRSADGSIYWNKFSSMGNGFTFELESLIFYAIALVSCDICALPTDEVSIFGDDTIIPIDAVFTFRRICELFGFTINQEKSFSSGYFRESCGAHYYNGVDCKPYFLKEKIRSITQLFTAANNVRLISYRELNRLGCSLRFKNLFYKLQRFIHPKIRLKISMGYGDVGFISNFDEVCPPRARDGFQGFLMRSLVTIPITKDVEGPALLCVRLTEHSDTARNNATELKGRVKLSVKRLLVFEWYDLGPWI